MKLWNNSGIYLIAKIEREFSPMHCFYTKDYDVFFLNDVGDDLPLL